MDLAWQRRSLETRHGSALARLGLVDGAVGALVLGHGAGGGVDAPDLGAVSAAARDHGWSVVLVEQPYRAAGRKAPPRAPVLDEAWLDVVGQLTASDLAGLPAVVGGRSAGARVACRTASASGAAGALCLAFPTRPPGRPDAPSRVPELDGAGVPVLVVQGARDPYGVPPEGAGRLVVTVPGDHSLRKDVTAVVAAVLPWLGALVASRTSDRTQGTA